MGSVMPLVALWERLGGDFRCVWLGTRGGVERGYIVNLGIEYRPIPAGKLRRYMSVKTLLAPFLIIGGLFAALYQIAVLRPKIAVISGSFVSVPVAWAAWLSTVPLVVHQEDLLIGMAGRATLQFASVATFAFAETLEMAKGKNKILIGNPVRKMFDNVDVAAAEAKWKKSGLPLVLVMGGGLGAQKLNEAVVAILPELSENAQVLHLTGKNKNAVVDDGAAVKNYQVFDGLWGADLAEAMKVADIVVSRAGLSAMSELSAMGKATIFVPLAGVGQTENAEYCVKRNAAMASNGEVQDLQEKILELLNDAPARKKMSENIRKIFPSDAAEKMEEVVREKITN